MPQKAKQLKIIRAICHKKCHKKYEKKVNKDQTNIPTEYVIMLERQVHGTGQNLLIQNDIKGIEVKHIKNIRIRKTQL